MNTLKLKRVHPDAVIPTYGTDGAACFDLYAVGGSPHTLIDGLTIFRTGWEMEVPEGYVLKLYSRSGSGFKHAVRLVNTTGIIDSDFRGEVVVGLIRDAARLPMMYVSPGDRIAQGMLELVERTKFVETGVLGKTLRGGGKFGSTGR